MSTPEQFAAARSGGIGDPGALANQEQAQMDAASIPSQVRWTTGDDRPLPPPNGPASSIEVAVA